MTQTNTIPSTPRQCEPNPETGKCTHTDPELAYHFCPTWHQNMEDQLDGVIRNALIHRGWSEEEARRFNMDTCICLPMADMAGRMNTGKSVLERRREMQHLITVEANQRVNMAERLLVEAGVKKVREEDGEIRAGSEESWVHV